MVVRSFHSRSKPTFVSTTMRERTLHQGCILIDMSSIPCEKDNERI